MLKHWIVACVVTAAALGLAPAGSLSAASVSAGETSEADDLTAVTTLIRQKDTDDRLTQYVPQLTDEVVKTNRAVFEAGLGDAWRLVDSFLVSYNLRAIAGRLDDDKKARLAALHELDRQVKKLLAELETVQGAGLVGAQGLPLVRYHHQRISAFLAHARCDKAAEIAALQKTIAEASHLCRAARGAYEDGVFSGTADKLIEASKYRCEAKMVLINLTTTDPAVATKARIAAVEEYLADVENLYKTVETKFKLAMGSAAEFSLVGYYYQETSAVLARARGDKAAEVAALEQAVARAKDLCKVARAKYDAGVVGGTLDAVLDTQICLSEAEAALICRTATDATEARQARLQMRRDCAEALENRLKRVEAQLGVGTADWADLAKAACDYLLIRLKMLEEQRAL